MFKFNELTKITETQNTGRRSADYNRTESEKIVTSKPSITMKRFFLGGGVVLLIGSIAIFYITILMKKDTKVADDTPVKSDLFVRRSFWNADLGRTGSMPLTRPVKRVIVMKSNVSEPYDKDSIGLFLKTEQFSSFYPDHEDIKENFIIGSDGTVFEGRGFFKEGQMTYDSFGTSYNNEAIGIKMLSENGTTAVQIKSLQSFLEECVNRKDLVKDFKLFYHEQLTQSGNEDEAFYEMIRKLENFHESNF